MLIQIEMYFYGQYHQLLNMFWLYFPFVITSLFLRFLYFKTGDYLLIASILFPIAELIIQVARKDNPDKNFNIFSSFALFTFSIFLMWGLLFWPGLLILMIPFVLVFVPCLLYFVFKRQRINARFIMVLFMIGIFVFLSKTPTYKVYEYYTIKNPFIVKSEQLSYHHIHQLAWFYKFGFRKAKAIATLKELKKDCQNLKTTVKVPSDTNVLNEINFFIEKDLKKLRKNEWEFFEPLPFYKVNEDGILVRSSK